MARAFTASVFAEGAGRALRSFQPHANTGAVRVSQPPVPSSEDHRNIVIALHVGDGIFVFADAGDLVHSVVIQR